MLDTKRIRADFPILARKENGQRLVYLDNAATSQKPLSVSGPTVRVLQPWPSKTRPSDRISTPPIIGMR